LSSKPATELGLEIRKPFFRPGKPQRLLKQFYCNRKIPPIQPIPGRYQASHSKATRCLL